MILRANTANSTRVLRMAQTLDLSNICHQIKYDKSRRSSSNSNGNNKSVGSCCADAPSSYKNRKKFENQPKYFSSRTMQVNHANLDAKEMPISTKKSIKAIKEGGDRIEKRKSSGSFNTSKDLSSSSSGFTIQGTASYGNEKTRTPNKTNQGGTHSTLLGKVSKNSTESFTGLALSRMLQQQKTQKQQNGDKSATWTASDLQMDQIRRQVSHLTSQAAPTEQMNQTLTPYREKTPQLNLDMRRIRTSDVSRHENLMSERLDVASNAQHNERAKVYDRVKKDLHKLTRNSRLSHSQTPRHRPVGSRIGGAISRASSVLSAVSSRSHVSQRSLMLTKKRKSMVTVTSQLSSRKSGGGKKMINQYQLLATVGIGSYGKVKKCLDTVSGKIFAVKIIARG